jgi:hypothetical protein
MEDRVMARVKVCHLGHRNPPTERFCKGVLDNGELCGTPIGSVPMTEEDASPSAQQEANAGTDGAAVVSKVSSGLGADRSSPARTTREMPQRQARVVFPWGSEIVDGCLTIGRDWEFSPLAGRLERMLAVSRMHAELKYDGERLILRHLGENNPTYVQGRPLATGESLELADGDDVAFSLDLKTRVRIG